MSQVAEAFVRVRPDAGGFGRELDRQTGPQLRRFENQLKGSNRELGRFSRGALVGTGALGGLGRAAAFASTSFLGGAGLVYGLKTAVGAASNLNEQTAKTKVVFDDAADSVIAFSQDALLLAKDQALDTASSIGALLRPLGVLPKQAADTSITLTKLGVDLSSFYNTSVSDALQAIKSGLVGEVEPLRRYGVVLSEARVQQQAFTETGKKSADQLTSQEKVLARVHLILRDTVQAQGDATRTSGGFANQMRELQKNIRNTEIVLGQALIPTLTDYLKKANDWLGQTENQERVQRDVNKAIEVGEDVVRGLTDALRIGKTVLGPVVDLVGGLGKAVEVLVAAMVVSKVRNFAAALGSIGPAGTRAAAGITAAGRAGGVGAGGRRGGRAGGAAVDILAALGFVYAFDKGQQAAAALLPGDNGNSGGRPLGPSRATVPIPGFPGVFLNQYGELVDASGKVHQVNTTGGSPAAAAAISHKIGPASGFGNLFPSRLSTRDEATATALARAEAGGVRSEITAAAKARLAFVNDTIAFANKLIAEGRGDTAKLNSTLQEFYGEQESIDAIFTGFAAADQQAKDKAKDDADAAIAKTKADAAEWRDKNHQFQLVFESLRHRISEFHERFRESVAAEAAAALERRENQSAIQLQILQNNLATAHLVPGTKAELAAEKRAQSVLVQWYKQRAKQLGLNTLAGQQAQGDYLAALANFRNLGKKDKAKAAGGFTLEELFQEAGSEFAMYGGNVGNILSPQDARGAFAGTVKTHQTTVVQNFYGERSAGQALADAAQVAKNMKD